MTEMKRKEHTKRADLRFLRVFIVHSWFSLWVNTYTGLEVSLQGLASNTEQKGNQQSWTNTTNKLYHVNLNPNQFAWHSIQAKCSRNFRIELNRNVRTIIAAAIEGLLEVPPHIVSAWRHALHELVRSGWDAAVEVKRPLHLLAFVIVVVLRRNPSSSAAGRSARSFSESEAPPGKIGRTRHSEDWGQAEVAVV